MNDELVKRLKEFAEVEIELHQDYLLARTIQIERELKTYA